MSREAEMFGAALKRWREKRGLTQEGLAHKAGISASYASHVERGEKVPTLTIILRLAGALDISACQLLSDFDTTEIKRLRFD
jgi:transcriptional regulator with XRE-family HTH domain